MSGKGWCIRVEEGAVIGDCKVVASAVKVIEAEMVQTCAEGGEWKQTGQYLYLQTRP